MARVSSQNQNGLTLANLLLFSIKIQMWYWKRPPIMIYVWSNASSCQYLTSTSSSSQPICWLPMLDIGYYVATIVPCFYCTVTNYSSITLTLIASWWDGERDSRSGRVTAPRKQSLCLCCGSQEYTSTSSCLLSTNSSSNDSSQSNWSSPVRTWQIKNHVY